jgi:hypothetical protein
VTDGGELVVVMSAALVAVAFAAASALGVAQ